ncbi:MAG TPA: hypothetical protein VND91_06785 [Candidatus Saccharimonadia bacterium]|nr:hypothetical protein [Candidatus Saccharimonadia bacterium]
MMIELLAALALGASSQAERCAHSDHPRDSDMICVNRIGHCTELVVDGHDTVPLTDEATARRVHEIKHDQDVCWQVTQPVSSTLRVQARAGGLRPSFVGAIETLRVNVHALDDYDPEFDSRLDSLNGVELVADGAPDGTWRLEAEKPLPAGEYVIVFRVFGVGNWDKQAVLLKLDPAIAPAPAK